MKIIKFLTVFGSLLLTANLACLTDCSSAKDKELPSGNYFIDLHLHADGALSVDTAIKLAEMQGVTLPTYDREKLSNLLTVPVDCEDLNEYLERFDLPCSLMLTKETINEAFYSIEEDLKKNGLIYAELRFAPQLHLAQGLTQEEVLLAAIEGCKRSDLKTNLILCCMRGNDNKEANMETVRLAAKYKDRGVVAVDLAGAEALFPTSDFEDVFAYAKELGLKYTIHAGEAAGYESVEKALDFGASRIGHGVHSVQNDATMKRLADAGIALELCVTSNLQTKAEPSLETYPLRKLMNSGVKVTLNTDNPTVSGTTIRRELELTKKAFALSDEEIKTILLNSVNASFADDATKYELRETIEKAFE